MERFLFLIRQIKTRFMKTLLLLLFLIPFLSFSQEPATVEQYCEVLIAQKAFTNKWTISIDYGDEPRRAFADYRLRDSRNDVVTFNTRIDALNFMGQKGWELAHGLPMPASNSSEYMYVFKKRVMRSELKNQIRQ
jgi:hypothetical protein